MRKNILELCLSPDLGGLELCTVDYFRYFRTQTSAYICVGPGTKLDEFLEDEYKLTLKRNKFFPIFPALKLAKLIDKHDIDLLHFHWTRDIAVAVLAKILSKKKPTLMQSRHMTMTRFKSDFYHKWLYKNIYMIHAVTNQVKEQLYKFIPQDIRPKIEMIYLGVDKPKLNEEIFMQIKKKYNVQDEFIIGMVGRIEDAKGQRILIEAISKLRELNIFVFIIGHTMDQKYLEMLKAEVHRLGIEKKLFFTGFTQNVNEYLGLCDVSILATQKETFGLVVIESMVNKVPVIATANGGPLEIIDDTVDGILFDRSVDDLVRKISLLYNDRELTKTLSFNAFNKVQNTFDKEKQMEKIYKVINES